MTISVSVVGASGYTGGEILRILSRHPRVRVTQITSEQYAGDSLKKVFPQFQSMPLGNHCCQALNVERVAAESDLVFCALPHLTSMKVVPDFLKRGCRVIDLSADFRLKDPALYQAWYGVSHRAPSLLKEAVYGLSELNRESLKSARLVANPGCYPTSVHLALAPLLLKNLVDTETIVIDSKSGVTGAGRSANRATLFSEVSDGLKAYKVITHRHLPEMDQELSRLAGRSLSIRFTPHLSPHLRGIFTTCYLRPRQKNDLLLSDYLSLYENFYRKENFVRLLTDGALPATMAVRGSNFCDLSLVLDSRTGWLMVFSAIDNLVKGAAGQAVQNMNIMLDIEESTGLEQVPVFP